MAHFDLFVIGGGSGGVACARRAASYGATVALCEDNRVGGTCVIRGCIPKKLMRYGAVFPDHFRAARGYGWRVEATHDWRALIAARDREIDRLNGVYIGMLEKAGVQLIRARGRLTAANAVEAGGETHTADRILIAPIYAARENTSLETRTLADELAARIRARGGDARFYPCLDQIIRTLDHESEPGDVLVTMGAGDVNRVQHEFTRRLQRHHSAG